MRIDDAASKTPARAERGLRTGSGYTICQNASSPPDPATAAEEITCGVSMTADSNSFINLIENRPAPEQRPIMRENAATLFNVA